MPTKPPPAAPPADEQSSDARPVATFISQHGSLIVYDNGHKIAEFAGGLFTTDDPKIIAALRGHELVMELT